VHPDWESGRPAPCVIWMHGRTANKELDPGRYLRWLRASGATSGGGSGGIGTCAVDLPGHGERMRPSMHDASDTPAMLEQMVSEIDEIVLAIRELGFDESRMGIGGMSAGGMAAIARLCLPHTFRCASVEATTGEWEMHFGDRIQKSDYLRIANPARNLVRWQEIPFQAIHSKQETAAALQRRFTD
jgi:predicted peptidase